MDEQSDYIDVDRTVVEPSPLRIRNILTLEERVHAIQAYNCRPVYTKVAKMFKCSWEQIKNIILNRDAILQFYEASKNNDKSAVPNFNTVRENKISFLNECLYEYVQRAQLYTNTDLSEDFLRTKALEFRDLIQLNHFRPNLAWINNFKSKYNFSPSNRIPPSSMELKDIMMYCSKHKLKIKEQKYMRFELSPEKTKIIKRKINFLEKALLEYIRRIQYLPRMSLNDDLLLKTAGNFRDLLKIDHFVPNRRWIDNFKKKYDINYLKKFKKTEVKYGITLDLLDILGYCRRLDKNGQLRNSNSFTSEDSIEHTNSDIYPISCNNDVKPTIAGFDGAINSRQEEYIPSLKRKRTDMTYSSSTNSCDRITEENLSKLIANYNDALKCLQPIEEFIMLQENYRAISLVTQLEEIFKNQPMDDNALISDQDLLSNSCEQNKEEELSKEIANYADALKCLQPIEKFVMLQKNYRAISLVTQLKQIFKNPPKYDNESDFSDTSSN